MTDTQALYQFYKSYGIDVYTSTNVPDDATFPYLTYEPLITNRGKDTYPTVTLWYHSNSDKEINDKAREIALDIGEGKSIQCDAGMICVYFTGEWTPMVLEADSTIKSRFTSLKITFNTF